MVLGSYLLFADSVTFTLKVVHIGSGVWPVAKMSMSVSVTSVPGFDGRPHFHVHAPANADILVGSRCPAIHTENWIKFLTHNFGLTQSQPLWTPGAVNGWIGVLVSPSSLSFFLFASQISKKKKLS